MEGLGHIVIRKKKCRNNISVPLSLSLSLSLTGSSSEVAFPYLRIYFMGPIFDVRLKKKEFTAVYFFESANIQLS